MARPPLARNPFSGGDFPASDACIYLVSLYLFYRKTRLYLSLLRPVL